MLDDPLERFPGQVEAVEIRIAMLQQGHDPQRLRVVVEAAIRHRGSIQRPLAGMAERRMAEIMRQRQRLRQVLVEPELPGQRAGDLGHLEGMGQPGPVVIALVIDEHLGLVFQPAERGRMDHPVAVAPERAAGPARRLVEQPAAAAVGIAGDRSRGELPFRLTRRFDPQIV